MKVKRSTIKNVVESIIRKLQETDEKNALKEIDPYGITYDILEQESRDENHVNYEKGDNLDVDPGNYADSHMEYDVSGRVFAGFIYNTINTIPWSSNVSDMTSYILSNSKIKNKIQKFFERYYH